MAQEARHTPGPWMWTKVDDDPDRQGWLNGPSESVAFVPYASGQAAKIAIRDADARLIAAAPDLLAALEEAQAAFARLAEPTVRHYTTSGMHERIASAIAAARGES